MNEVNVLPSDFDIRELRAKFKMSQTKFCETFNIPLNTLKNWEQGKRKMKSHVVLLLLMIEADPDLAMTLAAS